MRQPAHMRQGAEKPLFPASVGATIFWPMVACYAAVICFHLAASFHYGYHSPASHGVTAILCRGASRHASFGLGERG